MALPLGKGDPFFAAAEDFEGAFVGGLQGLLNTVDAADENMIGGWGQQRNWEVVDEQINRVERSDM